MSQRRLGKYELQERLGRGAIGATWKAFDTQQHRYVAIKIIAVNAADSSEFLAYFNREAQAVAALHHPNIVQIQEFFTSQNGNEAYIVMDYVEGQSLADYLDVTAHTGKIPPPAELVQLLTPIAAALDYAHQHRVVHGRLKPTAILLDKRSATPSLAGEPKLSNFEVRPRRDPRLLPLDAVAYIAPEIAQGYAGTNRSDLYALGVMLYELCTGTLPFQGETASDILMQRIHGTPTSPALINPQIRPALTGVIMRSMASDPAARFGSATALVTAVAKSLNVSMPESMSQSQLSRSVINPPSFSGSNDSLESMYDPTYFTPLPQQMPTQSSQALQSPLVPPVIASSNTPVLPLPPVLPASTPILPFSATGSVTQPPAQTATNVPTLPFEGATYATASTSTPTAVTAARAPQQGSLSPAPAAAPTSPARKRRRRAFSIVLLVVLLSALLGSTYLYYTHALLPTSQPLVGHTYFFSSGLISQSSNQGITDEVQINLQNIADPQAGKRYYGWLMNSNPTDVTDLALGALPVNHGHITKTYKDPHHNNLLASYNRFLITEEDANQEPTNPSLDMNAWRYYSAFSTAPNPADPKHFSLFDHLRHLLSQDPSLKNVGLTGGLDMWLFRNITKVLEAAGSARDAQKTCMANPSDACSSFILRQVTRILDYLDGATYVSTENVPAQIQGTKLLIDPTIARVALLEFDPVHQQPPGYLKHMGNHLQEISQISGSTANQRALASHINQAINNVQGWLDAVHADASQLIHMSSTQLLQVQTTTIFNDLFNQANFAFVGQVDPNTNNVKDGVVQIHYNVQALATFDVALCSMNNGQSSCG